MQRAEYKTISVWGLNVRYVEAGDGPVVLLLHGLADSLLSWYCNVDALADAGVEPAGITILLRANARPDGADLAIAIRELES